MKKGMLYIFFIGIIAISGILWLVESNKKEELPEIFNDSPSEIVVDDGQKQKAKINGLPVNLSPDVDLNAERAAHNNNEILGRLEIPDLFNVLVVQGPDNSYYLKRNIDRQSDERGSEFFDYRTGPYAKQINIYGHNTWDERIKVAFVKLQNFLDKDFFDNNQYIILQTDAGRMYFRILSFKQVHNYDKTHLQVDYTGSEFAAHIYDMSNGEGTIYNRDVNYDANSQIIVLQTCSHDWANSFYILVGIRVK